MDRISKGKATTFWVFHMITIGHAGNTNEADHSNYDCTGGTRR